MASKGVFITGASSGIGLALAREFAKTGEYNLALTARRVDRLQALKEELLNLYPSIKVEVRQLDVSSFHDISPVFNDLAKAIGGIELVIANAGVFHGGLAGSEQTADPNNTANQIAINLTGAIITTDVAVRYFKEHPAIPGHVVGISSVLAFRGAPGTAVYSATKAALDLYLNVVQQEAIQTQSGLTVTSVFPGLTASEMTAAGGFDRLPHIITAEASAQKILGLIKAKAPQGIVPLF